MSSAFKTALVISTIALAVVFLWDRFYSTPGGTASFSMASVNAYAAFDGKEPKPAEKAEATADIAIINKWSLPSRLKEVSGIVYLGNNEFACIQDEEGKIFIYNAAKDKMDEDIEFGPAGDYEGIAVAGSTAYVVRADGVIYEVQGFREKKPDVRQYATHLTASHNVEGLCYDNKKNRLLLAIKGNEQHTNDYKGIYAFSLSDKKLSDKPVYKIELKHAIWKQNKDKTKSFNPSGMTIHPKTGAIYIVDGTKPSLLVMTPEGKMENLYQLEKADFEQPEGITFSPEGDLFISNEGGKGKGKGNILRVKIQP